MVNQLQKPQNLCSIVCVKWLSGVPADAMKQYFLKKLNKNRFDYKIHQVIREKIISSQSLPCAFKT